MCEERGTRYRCPTAGCDYDLCGDCFCCGSEGGPEGGSVGNDTSGGDICGGGEDAGGDGEGGEGDDGNDGDDGDDGGGGDGEDCGKRLPLNLPGLVGVDGGGVGGGGEDVEGVEVGATSGTSSGTQDIQEAAVEVKGVGGMAGIREGVWEPGVTAGGCSSHDTWRQNPQFVLSVSRPTVITFILTQECPRLGLGRSGKRGDRKGESNWGKASLGGGKEAAEATATEEAKEAKEAKEEGTRTASAGTGAGEGTGQEEGMVDGGGRMRVSPIGMYIAPLDASGALNAPTTETQSFPSSSSSSSSLSLSGPEPRWLEPSSPSFMAPCALVNGGGGGGGDGGDSGGGGGDGGDDPLLAAALAMSLAMSGGDVSGGKDSDDAGSGAVIAQENCSGVRGNQAWWGARESAPTGVDCFASDFVAGRQVALFRVSLTPGAWVVVPCTYEPGTGERGVRFWLRAVVHGGGKGIP